MIPRYTRPDMAAIWSPQTRFRIWFEIEAHAADAMAELGIIPKEAAKKIWAKGKTAKFDAARIDAIEREVKHDVVAFLTHLAEIVGPEARFVHQGMTSSDVLDTCFNVQLIRAADILLADVEALKAALKRRAYEYKLTPTIGRSHGIHAEPTTFGLKLAFAYAEFDRAGGRHFRAGRSARRSPCRGEDEAEGRADLLADHSARPPRHVFRHARRRRRLGRAAGDRNPPPAAHRGAGSRGVLLRRPERLLVDAAQA
jgi:Lyase